MCAYAGNASTPFQANFPDSGVLHAYLREGAEHHLVVQLEIL